MQTVGKLERVRNRGRRRGGRQKQAIKMVCCGQRTRCWNILEMKRLRVMIRHRV